MSQFSQFSLVPWQSNSGGKARLGRINKAGERYLRTLLMLGAKSVLANAPNTPDITISGTL